MQSAFSFTLPQTLLLNQLLHIQRWVGAPLDSLAENPEQWGTSLKSAVVELEQSGWIARQADGSVGVAEGLLAVLQAVRDAQTIAYAAGYEDDVLVNSLVVFVDESHYVVQTWQTNGRIEFHPWVDTAGLIGFIRQEFSLLVAHSHAAEIRGGRMAIIDGEWQTVDLNHEIVPHGKPAVEGLPKGIQVLLDVLLSSIRS